ncbi:hypothetical protein A2625_00405 [candidate division WOR-1 bacterium RIFCSPHIGHO2_01_FULL_53_15]|uniref:Uncharacterized protein n=1 Tax=candidate division WOR-1 bacterium RIFCSPHIGHO2_01_FULL_53_15 TaxID=1802564 RepID=A0A1F4PYP9_UNCSA|nr:MAG: hypothetical protein A2625_00405 [candidate division WOR-1 bacterium RIFCSPHIGHO2_01_FULL_53_15]OGC10482.1 MAG: hypothetical protein A3D23_03495 [candidate division WOR-1 bacterium RIFCSPHIGHO2_02_FULL_53_26]
MAATIIYAGFTYWPVLSPLIVRPRPAPVVSVPAPIKPAAKTEAAAKKVDLFELAESTAEVKLVDPFALRTTVRGKEELPPPTLPGEPSPKPAEPVLQGIWLDAGMKIAFISDQVVAPGGAVLGWKVVSITQNQVTLQKGSATKILKLEGR